MNGALKSAIYSSMMEYKTGSLNQRGCDGFDVRHGVVSTSTPLRVLFLQQYATMLTGAQLHTHVAVIQTVEFSATRRFVGWEM